MKMNTMKEIINAEHTYCSAGPHFRCTVKIEKVSEKKNIMIVENFVFRMALPLQEIACILDLKHLNSFVQMLNLPIEVYEIAKIVPFYLIL